MVTPMEPGIAFVVGCARSGTTLIRRVLDAHRDVAAPAEANIPALIDQVGHTWRTVSGGHHELPLRDLPDDVRGEIRAAALRPVQACCARAGARVYCDKSLGALDSLPAVADVLPDARYILVFRHVMDVVASALEASPWGFRGYGFLPFVERSMDNFVAGLVEYWVAHSGAALDWQTRHEEACHLVRYEDLVAEPEPRAAALFSFLGVVDDATSLRRAFATPGAGVLGDHKISYTDGIHGESVGRGRTVPVALVPPPLRDAANGYLAELGYRPLTDDWNRTAASPEGGRPGRLTPAARRAGEALVAAIGALDVRGPGPPFALTVDDRPDLRWLVDPAAGAVTAGARGGDFAIVGAARDLLAVVRGDDNAGSLLRSGRLRYAGPQPEGYEVAHVRHALAALRTAYNAAR
jgi:hypothetical protein